MAGRPRLARPRRRRHRYRPPSERDEPTTKCTTTTSQAKVEGRFLGGRPPSGYRLADAGPHPTQAKPPTAAAYTSSNPPDNRPAAEVFDQDSYDGVVVLLDKEPGPDSTDRVLTASALCPARAIRVTQG